MITPAQLTEAMTGALHRAATRLPPDVRSALQRALDEERDPLARAHLESSLQNADAAQRGGGLVCADTGFPLFFIRAGAAVQLEGGFGMLQPAAEAAVAQATAANDLRPTMVDPVSRDNPGNNLGPGMPRIDLRFTGDGDTLDILAAPKGGGSEIFGTFYRMLYPSDGLHGVKQFVIECIRDACYAGKICPPAIIGVGLGGTADLCMKLAKQAAILTPVGSFSPDPVLAGLEHELLAAARSLGVGPMGARGINAVMGLRIRKAATHTAALPVAVNAQCMVGRRWRAILHNDGNPEYTGDIPEGWDV